MLSVRLALAVLTSLLLVGCSESTQLSVTPAQLEFQAVNGQSALPAAQEVSVSGARGMGVGYSVTYMGGARDWLSVPASGTTPQTLSLQPTTTDLPPGTYFAVVQLTPGNGRPAVQLTVSYAIGAPPVIFEPARLDFWAVQGQYMPPSGQGLFINGAQDRAVSYSVTVTYTGGAQDWLRVPPAGVVTPAFLYLQPSTTTLPPGTHNAVLTFTPTNNLPPVQFPVTYTVTAPGIAVAPTQLGFTAYSGQSTRPAAQGVRVTGEQDTAVGYALTVTYAGGAQDWLSVPASGTTPQTLSLQPTTTALPAGTYSAVVRLTPGNGRPAVQLTVTYTVSAPGIAVAPTQLGFTAYSGQSTRPAAQGVSITGEQGTAVGYALTVTYTGGAQEWLSVPASGTTPQTLSLQPTTTDLPAGTYSAVVRLTPDNGRPAVQLTVTYTVSAPGLVVAPTQLGFTASSDQSTLPAAQSVRVTGEQDLAVGYALTVTYTGGAQEWLSAPVSGTTPQTLSLQPTTTALPAGTYSAVVRLTPGNGRPAVQLTVTYTVSAPELRVSPSALTLRVDAATTEAQLTSPLVLTSTGTSLSWRVVSVDAPWLDTPSTSGNTQTGTGLDLVVRKSALDGMNNGTHAGTLTLAYSSASNAERQLQVNVQLTLALPQVRTVAPYATEAGRSYSHILRGEGFSALQSSQHLHFGTTEATTFQVISDTEIRLTVPALPVGDHVVLADNALGVSRPGARLHAVQTPVFTETSLPRDNRAPQRIIYDPLRTAIYTVDWNPDTGVSGLYRTRYVNGAWEDALYVSLPQITDAAMDIDGQSLYLAIGTGLYRLDLNDASATPRFLRTIPEYSQLEVLNDGYLLLGGYCTNVATSLDGRRTMIVYEGCSSGPVPVKTFEASTGQYQTTPVIWNYFVGGQRAIDRTARHAVISRSIYDEQWNLIAGLTSYLFGMAFSHDGRRLYGFYTNSSSKRAMQVYDVSGSPTGGQFPLLYDAPVSGATASEEIGDSVFTPDGRTLIRASKLRFHVWPIPPSLQ